MPSPVVAHEHILPSCCGPLAAQFVFASPRVFAYGPPGGEEPAEEDPQAAMEGTAAQNAPQAIALPEDAAGREPADEVPDGAAEADSGEFPEDDE